MKISGLGLEGVVLLEQIPAKLARRVQNWFSSGQFSRWQGRRNLLEIGGCKRWWISDGAPVGRSFWRTPLTDNIFLENAWMYLHFRTFYLKRQRNDFWLYHALFKEAKHIHTYCHDRLWSSWPLFVGHVCPCTPCKCCKSSASVMVEHRYWFIRRRMLNERS